MSGIVLTVNPQLKEHPSTINEDLYNEGWLMGVRLQDNAELDQLTDMDEYYHFVFKEK